VKRAEMEEKLRKERDREMMQSPDEWPHWPYLPLKRGVLNVNREHGLLIDHASYRTSVFLIGLFSVGKVPIGAVPRSIYESVEAIQRAGWRID
jgi:hypothetical protein